MSNQNKVKEKEFDTELLKESVLCECSDKGNDLTFIEASEWEQDGKFQSREVIFMHDGRYYSICESRSGSPFSDWYYDSEDWGSTVRCCEVRPTEITSKVWSVVRESEETKTAVVKEKLEIEKELYVLADVRDGKVLGYPSGGGSSTAQYVRAFENKSRCKRSSVRLGGTVLKVIAVEEAD